MSEPVVFFKIEVPFCTREHGVSPCTATQSGDAKCFNTSITCNDPENFFKGSRDLIFSRGMPAERRVDGASGILPFIRSVSTTPGTMNFAGSSKVQGGLGYTSTLKVVFDNRPYSGLLTDLNVADRTYGPREQGLFWTNWLVRNPFYIGLKCTLYEGYAGEALAAMQRRIFYVTSVESSRDGATIKAQDPTSFLKGQVSQVPKPSPGVLISDITADQVDIPLTRCTVADYPAPGVVQIGAERVSYSSVFEGPRGPILRAEFRGDQETEALAHSEGAAVQKCFVVSDAHIDTAIQQILDESEMPAGILDATQAAAEVAKWRRPWQGLINRTVGKPTAATDLIGEICRQSLVSMDYDEYSGKYKLFAVHGYDSTSRVFTGRSGLIEGSVKITSMPEQRASRIYMHVGLRSPTLDPEDPINYRSHYLIGNGGESENEFGVAAQRDIFVKWYEHQVLLAATGSRLAALTKFVPRKISFQLAPKDRGVRRGDIVRIESPETPDFNGLDKVEPWVLTKVYEPNIGGVLECEGWGIKGLGRCGYILPNGTPPFVGDGSDDPDGAYIVRDDGKLPDGSEGWVIQ